MFSTFRNMAIGAAALALATGFAAPARANLVTDPGFESCSAIGSGGVPPGWIGGACTNSPLQVHSGLWAAALTMTDGTLQSIATTPGALYDFSFWLRNDSGISFNGFTASFGSNTVLILSNTTNPSSYTFEDFTVSAAAVSTIIGFAAHRGSWEVDDVSVTLAPEPASLTLLAVGLAGLGMTLRLRRA